MAVAPQTEPDSGGMCGRKGQSLLQPKTQPQVHSIEQLSPANEDTDVEWCELDMPECLHPTES